MPGGVQDLLHVSRVRIQILLKKTHTMTHCTFIRTMRSLHQGQAMKCERDVCICKTRQEFKFQYRTTYRWRRSTIRKGNTKLYVHSFSLLHEQTILKVSPARRWWLDVFKSELDGPKYVYHFLLVITASSCLCSAESGQTGERIQSVNENIMNKELSSVLKLKKMKN